LEGGLRFMQNEPVELVMAEVVKASAPPRLEEDDHSYGYDVQFLLYGKQLDVAAIRAYLETMGQSVLVVGGRQQAKIHIHSADPGPILTYGATLGLVTDLLVEDLAAQVKAFINQAPRDSVYLVKQPLKTVVIAVVPPGEGLIDIFYSLRADQLILKSETAMPDIQPWLNLIAAIEADRIIVLPDNSDMISIFEQVQKRLKKELAIIPTRTVPQGLAALLAFNRQLDFEVNLQRMLQASRQIRTLEVRPAGQPGEILGFYEDRLIISGSDERRVALELLAGIETQMWEIITIYVGQNGSQKGADQLAGQINERYPEVTVEVYYGGQPRSYYIISLE
jgi:dihydroxyacetone kinase-like predicted kinase